MSLWFKLLLNLSLFKTQKVHWKIESRWHMGEINCTILALCNPFIHPQLPQQGHAEVEMTTRSTNRCKQTQTTANPLNKQTMSYYSVVKYRKILLKSILRGNCHACNQTGHAFSKIKKLWIIYLIYNNPKTVNISGWPDLQSLSISHQLDLSTALPLIY